MSKMIHNYTAAGTIDASADLLLIDPASSGIYKSINRNTLLALNSQPLGLTDSQSPQNKTLDNTNSITVKDGSLTIQNSSSTTKQAVFSAASITAGQTRTFTLPDASTTLVGTGATQTLTNKTLTAPIISGGTIDNSTITTDSISGHTSATIVTVANLQISNGVLNTNNSVVTANVTDAAVTPAKLIAGTGTGWAWSSWTPTWTNVTIGNGSVNYSKYIQIGKTVFFRVKVTLGSTSAITGNITFTVPVAENADYLPSVPVDATIWLVDVGVNNYPGFARIDNSGKIALYCIKADATVSYLFGTDGATPFTWGSGDGFYCFGSYEAA